MLASTTHSMPTRNERGDLPQSVCSPSAFGSLSLYLYSRVIKCHGEVLECSNHLLQRINIRLRSIDFSEGILGSPIVLNDFIFLASSFSSILDVGPCQRQSILCRMR